MRCMRRNKQPFWYCLYLDDRKPDAGDTNYIYDEYGNETGERILRYAAPVRAMGNISPATGRTSVELFGNAENYDKVIVMERDCPITENSVLFIDREPETVEIPTYEPTAVTVVEKTYSVPHPDYVVRRVAKSLNSVTLAVMKVR